MVKVPRTQIRTVRTKAPPRVYLTKSAPIEAFGGGKQKLTQATSVFLEEATNLVEKEQKRADDALFLDGSAKLAQVELDIQSKRNERRGKDVGSLPEEEEALRKEAYRKIFEEAGNYRVKNRLESIAIKNRLSAQRSLNVYMDQENRKFMEESKKAFIENTRTLAINSGSDQEIANSIEFNSIVIKRAGEQDGKSKEAIDKEIFDEASKTHILNIERLLQADTDLAKEYYNENKAQINSSILSKSDLDKKVEAVHKLNVRAIEESLNDKILNDSLTAEDVLSVGQDVSKGGIGAKKANEYINKVKRNQNARIKEIIEGDVNAEDYINLIERLVKKPKDSFMFKQILVDAWEDGFLNDKEKADLKALADRFAEIEKNDNPHWLIHPFSAFHNFRETKKGKNRNTEVATSLKSLIYRIGRGDDPQEATLEINRADVAAKHPQRANYEVGKTYTEKGIKFKFNGFLTVDDMEVDRID